MKKLILIILVIGILCFLPFVKLNDNINVNVYNEYLNELEMYNGVYDKTLPFNIEINLEELSKGQYIYELKIDNAKYKCENLEILIVHNKETEDIFPSLGIVEDKLTLWNITDKKSNIAKGILLMGYVQSVDDIEFRVLIKYKIDDKKYTKYYLQQF